MKIHVIFRNGVAEAVLSDAPAGQEPKVEIVEIDDDYADLAQLNRHVEGLYENPALREIAYETADFSGGKGD